MSTNLINLLILFIYLTLYILFHFQRLANRIKVGDFVDAQDSSGKWYESVVQAVTQDIITVHFFGWNSRWDAELSKDYSTELVKKIPPPQPLWSHTTNWRENLKDGDIVEIREASSSIRKPVSNQNGRYTLRFYTQLSFD